MNFVFGSYEQSAAFIAHLVSKRIDFSVVYTTGGVTEVVVGNHLNGTKFSELVKVGKFLCETIPIDKERP